MIKAKAIAQQLVQIGGDGGVVNQIKVRCTPTEDIPPPVGRGFRGGCLGNLLVKKLIQHVQLPSIKCIRHSNKALQVKEVTFVCMHQFARLGEVVENNYGYFEKVRTLRCEPFCVIYNHCIVA